MTVEATSPPSPALPTSRVTTFPSTGTYTIPASTITVTEETTVCGATTTSVPSGTVTVGGVTTIVETSTVITCPYATVSPSGSTVTSVIETTTYTCPAAGTYTIAPITTSVPTSTVLVIPTPASFTPGTYTQPEQTVTVTETDSVYVCPFATGSSSSAPAAPPAPTSSAAPAPPAPAPSTSSAPASSDVSSTGTVGYSGDRYGITLDPYTSSGDCSDQGTIASQVAAAAAKGFKNIRIYSTDCNGLEYVGQAVAANGMKLIPGVWIGSSDLSAAQEQVQQIVQWGQWDLVEFIVVGNEAVFSGFVSASQLAGFVSSAASAFKSAGYTGHVTTTEPVDIWQADGSTICGAVDLVCSNIHAFFNADATPATAGSFVLSEIELLDQICPGKEVVNCETGWPTAGQANGAAVPGVAEQAEALKNIASMVGGKSVFFSYANEPWKAPGYLGVEQSWGCFDAFD